VEGREVEQDQQHDADDDAAGYNRYLALRRRAARQRLLWLSRLDR